MSTFHDGTSALCSSLSISSSCIFMLVTLSLPLNLLDGANKMQLFGFYFSTFFFRMKSF